MNRTDRIRLETRARELAAELPLPVFYRDHGEELRRAQSVLDNAPRISRFKDAIRETGANLGHGIKHATLVARDAGALMLIEADNRDDIEVDRERLVLIAVVAGLLHDVRRTSRNHAQAGAEAAEKSLADDPFFRPAERRAIVTAIRNHEAFKEPVACPDPLSSLLSNALYDADKFRWGPDNFTDTLWRMIDARGQLSLESLYRSFLENLEYIGRISATFRSAAGKRFGPEFIEQGMTIGRRLYEEIKRIMEGPRMELITRLEDIGGRSRNAVVTLGNFDGLHVGHQELVRRVIDRAAKRKGTSVAFTFHPHPLKVLSPGTCPELISTYDEKVALFEELGVDLLVILGFTKTFATMSAEDFARIVLQENLDAKEVLVGFNYRFGRNREGDVARLREFGARMGFEVVEIPEVSVENEIVSSTKIRDLLRAGDVSHAARLLGRSYAVTGTVVEGDKRGRTLGFPTANLDPKHEILPYPGVYAANVFVERDQLNGIVNVGYRPTFDKHDLCCEVHIFNFDKDIYGKEITVFFIEKIRNEKRFNSVEALVNQIGRDIKQAGEILRSGRMPSADVGSGK